mmetsp:Transcript_140695/g.448769  ORF Transcript_140695/g.448769 Transcript_140695/m.448769 type:complete len:573 (+) Transcript_140695:2-1720(+)
MYENAPSSATRVRGGLHRSEATARRSDTALAHGHSELDLHQHRLLLQPLVLKGGGGGDADGTHDSTRERSAGHRRGRLARDRHGLLVQQHVHLLGERAPAVHDLRRVHRVAAVVGEAEPHAAVAPVVDGVVPVEHRLPKDEELRTQRRREPHRHQPRPAKAADLLLLLLAGRGGCPWCGCWSGCRWRCSIRCSRLRLCRRGGHGGSVGRDRLRGALGCGGRCCGSGGSVRGRSSRLVRLVRGGHEDALRGAHGDTLAERQPAHVVVRMERQRVAWQVDLHLRRIYEAAVQQVPRLPREQVRHLLVGWSGDAEVGGAGVHDSAASAVLADVELHAVDAHGQDADLPMAVLGHHHGSPGQRLQQPPVVDAAEGHLGVLTLLALGQEDAKLRGGKALPKEHLEEAELLVQRQAVKAEAEDAVEAEGLEGRRGHLHGQDDAHLHAHLGASTLVRRTLRDDDRARIDRGGGFVGAWRLGAGADDAEADNVLRELARDLAGAEADGHLVAMLALGHQRAVGVDGDGGLGGGHVELAAALHHAGLGRALGGGQHQVPGAGVEDNPELLRGRAQGEHPGV